MTRGSGADWSSEVRPYLDKLAAHLSERGASDHSVSVPLGAGRLLVTPVEQRLVLGRTSAVSGAEERRLGLVRDALGLRVKILADRRSLTRGGQAQRAECVQRLQRDIEFGHGLLSAMRAEMTALAAVTSLDDTRQFQVYRTRLVEAMQLAEKEIGRGAAQPAEEPVPQTAARAPSVSKRRQRSVKGDADTPEPGRGESGARTKRMVAAVLCTALAVVVVVLFLNRQRELDHFVMEDFSAIKGVEQVINRPPDMLVVFSEQTWQSMSSEQRYSAATAVGELIRPAGYRRGILRTARRPKLAEWRRFGGVTVFE